MRRTTAVLSLLLGLCLFAIAGLVAQPLLVDVFATGGGPSGVGAYGSETAWHLSVSFQHGRPWANFHLRMDNMERRPETTYRLICKAPWAPQWEGRLQGKIGDFVSLTYMGVSPEALDEAAVRALIEGCQVDLAWAAGEITWPPEALACSHCAKSWSAGEKTITFQPGDEGVRRPAPRERLLRFWLTPWTGQWYDDH